MKPLQLIGIAAATALAAAAADARDYRLLSSWDQNYPYNPYILDPFIEGVAEATEGRVNIVFSGPETVAPFEQLEPVGAGVFDFLFTHGAYHFGTTPIMMAADALVGDVDKIQDSGVFDVLDEHYQQFGLKLVSLPVTPDGAYHIMLREPVSEDGDLAGRKIRGTLTYKGVVEMLGGVLVVLPASEIYTALEKGLVDGAAWPIIGALDYGWYEVADYLLRPGMGANFEPIFMNLETWNGLSEEDQAAILEVGRQVEESWFVDAPKVWAEEEQALIEKGMQITEMGADELEKLDAAWAGSLWALAEEANPEATEKLKTFAEEKGITR